MQRTRILITGAAGFIGSSLTRELVHRGYDVRGVDNLSTGRIENLAEVLPSMQFVEGDLLDTSLIGDLCGGVDVIFHEAALPSVFDSVVDPLRSHQSNVEGTLRLLIAAKRQRVRRVVYAASAAAYGESETGPKHEAMAPAPISPYAVQKLAGEHYMQSFARVYGMETVCLRYFNVYGPFQSANSPYSGVLARFISEMLAGNPVTIFGDGNQSRDFTYIEDVIQANLLAAAAPADIASGRVYNAAYGKSHTLMETHRALCDLLGRRGCVVFMPPRQGDILHSRADIQRAQDDLGYHPRVDFVEGLRRTVNWYASHQLGGTLVVGPSTGSQADLLK
jgi:nucleoside-diphosphate-sugar epimerase